MTTTTTTLDPARFFGEAWGIRPESFRCPGPLDAPTSAEIWEQFDCGQFVSPYFAVLRDGRAVPLGAVTETRVVQQRPRPGYADGAAVREHFATGHTVRLNESDHWHPGIKELAAGLRTELRAAVRCALFLGPAGSTGAPVRSARDHVIAVQLEGRTDWKVGGEADAFVLEPGQALYIPAGRAHTARVGEGESLHLALSVRRPSPRDLAGTAVAGFLDGTAVDAIAGTHHYLTLDEKVAWLRTELSAYLSGQDVGALVREAVAGLQRADRAA